MWSTLFTCCRTSLPSHPCMITAECYCLKSWIKVWLLLVGDPKSQKPSRNGFDLTRLVIFCWPWFFNRRHPQVQESRGLLSRCSCEHYEISPYIYVINLQMEKFKKKGKFEEIFYEYFNISQNDLKLTPIMHNKYGNE